ncbi:myoI, partial [Symbiodinium microadriaticum]
MELTYSSTGFILRSSTTNFLLEKCRVHRQGTGERSFHIFYQLCRAAEYATNALASSYDDNGEPLSPMVSYASTLDSQADGQREGGGEAKGHCSVLDDADFLRSLSLGPPEQFDYLSQSGCVNITGLDDVRGLIATESAASTLGLGEQSVRSLFALCAAVLHLGNICFRDTNTADGMEYCEVMDDDKCKRALRSVSLLLGLSEQDLVQGLSSREISIRGERTTVRLTARQSLESRDALSKSLFSNAFNWIVRNVNVTFTPPVQSAARRPSIAVGAKSKENFIGILDIFGFEIFDSNSLEQLCINYANEKLQELFNRNVFKKEEQLYSEEGIPFDELIFADNQDVLNLIEDKHVGILSIVDDEVNIPRATDLTLLRKLNQAHLTAASGNDSGAIKNKVMGSAASGKERALVSASKRFLPATSAANDSFVIDHFAG